MGKILRVVAIFGMGLLASACTPCGDWSQFNSFPKVCHSSGNVK